MYKHALLISKLRLQSQGRANQRRALYTLHLFNSNITTTVMSKTDKSIHDVIIANGHLLC